MRHKPTQTEGELQASSDIHTQTTRQVTDRERVRNIQTSTRRQITGQGRVQNIHTQTTIEQSQVEGESKTSTHSHKSPLSHRPPQTSHRPKLSPSFTRASHNAPLTEGTFTDGHKTITEQKETHRPSQTSPIPRGNHILVPARGEITHQSHNEGKFTDQSQKQSQNVGGIHRISDQPQNEWRDIHRPSAGESGVRRNTSSSHDTLLWYR